MSSQQIINIGTLPNDGDGDPMRTAFSKVNNNFTNLYATSTTTLTANTTSNTANQSIWLLPVASFTQGTFQIRSHNPATNDSQDITLSAQLLTDASDVKWTGYATTINGNVVVSAYNMQVSTGNVVITVSPTVNGNVTHFIASSVTD